MRLKLAKLLNLYQISEVALKEVFYVRHAKSAWDDPSQSDLERPLNERGHQTAFKMAEFVQHKFNLKDVQLISSPAKRALKTAEYFAEKFKISKKEIIEDKNLYFGDEFDYLKCLQTINSSKSVAFVFGHNPTIENLVRKIGNPYLGLVPTCAVFHTILKPGSKIELKFEDLNLVNYYFPKIVLTK